jgi:hypothetical protein
MAKSEKTSSRVATQSSKVLKDARASDRAKSLAGSALAQAGTKKQTSSGVARKAGAVLADPRTRPTTRSLAGSVLTQTTGKSKSTPGAAKGGATKSSAKSLAGSALTQHVSTRRTADGQTTRVVLKPISSGALAPRRVEQAVSRVLTGRKSKK